MASSDFLSSNSCSSRQHRLSRGVGIGPHDPQVHQLLLPTRNASTSTSSGSSSLLLSDCSVVRPQHILVQTDTASVESRQQHSSVQHLLQVLPTAPPPSLFTLIMFKNFPVYKTMQGRYESPTENSKDQFGLDHHVAFRSRHYMTSHGWSRDLHVGSCGRRNQSCKIF